MRHHLTLLFVLIPLTAACGSDADHNATDAGVHNAGDAPHVADAPSDQGAVVDAPAPPPDAAPGDGGGAPPVLHGCAAADYVDRSGGADSDRVVRPRGTTGYTPGCLMIRAGQSVTFEMNFTTHPLVPGIAHGPTAGATSPNPIARQSAGMTYTVAFPSAGYFPFYCSTHAHLNMVGVVQVMP